MNCSICRQPITGRGGQYCGRCAGLNGVMHDWDKVRQIRQREVGEVIVQGQRTLGI